MKESLKTLYYIVTFSFTLPFISIIVINLILCIFAVKFAHKMGKSNYQACLTTFGISTVLILSWLPSLILLAVPREQVPAHVRDYGNKVTSLLFTLSTCGNPIVYSVCHRGIRKRVMGILGVIRTTHTNRQIQSKESVSKRASVNRVYPVSNINVVDQL